MEFIHIFPVFTAENLHLSDSRVGLDWIHGHGKHPGTCYEITRWGSKVDLCTIELLALCGIYGDMLNPAESLSKGLLFSKILWKDLWFQEPSLLLLGDTANSEFSLRNLNLKGHVTLLNIMNLKKGIQSKEVDLRLSDIKTFRSLDKILVVTVYLFSFIVNLKNSLNKERINLSKRITM